MEYRKPPSRSYQSVITTSQLSVCSPHIHLVETLPGQEVCLLTAGGSWRERERLLCCGRSSPTRLSSLVTTEESQTDGASLEAQHSPLLGHISLVVTSFFPENISPAKIFQSSEKYLIVVKIFEPGVPLCEHCWCRQQWPASGTTSGVQWSAETNLTVLPRQHLTSYSPTSYILHTLC